MPPSDPVTSNTNWYRLILTQYQQLLSHTDPVHCTASSPRNAQLSQLDLVHSLFAKATKIDVMIFLGMKQSKCFYWTGQMSCCFCIKDTVCFREAPSPHTCKCSLLLKDTSNSLQTWWKWVNSSKHLLWGKCFHIPQLVKKPFDQCEITTHWRAFNIHEKSGHSLVKLTYSAEICWCPRSIKLLVFGK